MNESEAPERYEDRFPVWQEFLDRLRSIIEPLIGDRPRVHSTHYRIKSLAAITQRLRELGTADLSRVPDIVGIRIVMDEQGDVSSIVKLVKQALEVDRRYEHTWEDEPGYQRVDLVVRIGKDRERLTEWQPFRGLQAEIQIQTVLVSVWDEVEHFLYKLSPEAPASEKRQAARARADDLDAIIDEFEALLERPGVHEKRDIHPFLKAHSFILHPNPEAIFSEVPIGLGTQHRMDFLIRESDGSYILVEIENPHHPLFTKKGNFSSGVSHAERQVEDWQEWIESNLPTVEKKYPGMASPRGLVVIGRSKGWSKPEPHKKLARRNTNLRGQLTIRTYDDLAANARSFVASIRKHL